MKSSIVVTFVGYAVSLASAGLSAETDELDAIKSVIHSETEAFYKRDADRWQVAWSHEANVTRTLVSSSRYYSVVGWEKFGPRIVNGLRQAGQAIPIEFKNDNYTIHVGDSVAWVEYDQTMHLLATEPKRKRVSREHRALTKTNGQWKIVAQITHDLPWPSE